MNEKIKNSIENYEKALKKLHEFLSEPIVNDRDRAGIIKAFEFTWLMMLKPPIFIIENGISVRH